LLNCQLAGDFVAGVFADGDVTRSVILGERNAAAMAALQQALDGGCRKVAILYGGAHLPDLARRMEADFESSYGGTQWITAWCVLCSAPAQRCKSCES
jgi:hypothetical protein